MKAKSLNRDEKFLTIFSFYFVDTGFISYISGLAVNGAPLTLPAAARPRRPTTSATALWISRPTRLSGIAPVSLAKTFLNYLESPKVATFVLHDHYK